MQKRRAGLSAVSQFGQQSLLTNHGRQATDTDAATLVSLRSNAL